VPILNYNMFENTLAHQSDRLRFDRRACNHTCAHTVRTNGVVLMFYDLETRGLLRTRPNPLTLEQVNRLRGVRPAEPPPRRSTEPIRVQRRASNTGVVMVCGQMRNQRVTGYTDQPLSTIRRGLSIRSDARCVD
jgi:hypothetical protein